MLADFFSQSRWLITCLIEFGNALKALSSNDRVFFLHKVLDSERPAKTKHSILVSTILFISTKGPTLTPHLPDRCLWQTHKGGDCRGIGIASERRCKRSRRRIPSLRLLMLVGLATWSLLRIITKGMATAGSCAGDLLTKIPHQVILNNFSGYHIC